MNKVLYIILISLFSFTIISCSKKDESSSSSSSSIKLSDIDTNLTNIIGKINEKHRHLLKRWAAAMTFPEWFTDLVFQQGFLGSPSYKRKVNLLIMTEIIVIFYLLYLLIWLFWMREPSKGIADNRTTPPDGLSPASARYLYKKGYDNVSFVCAIASAGSKGFLSVKFRDLWMVSKKDKNIKNELAPDEEAAFDSFFVNEATVELTRTNLELIKKSLSAHEEHLEEKLDRYFVFHTRLWVVALFLYLISVSVMALLVKGTFTPLISSSGSSGGLNIFTLIVILIIGFLGVEIFYFLIEGAILWITGQSSFSNSLSKSGNLFSILFSLFFCSFSMVAVWIILSPEILLFFLVIRLLTKWFFAKTNQFTLQGRQMMDQLENFRDYLLQREYKDIHSVSRASLDSTALQQWIPFAIALEIERDLIDLTGKFSSFPSWYEGGRLSDLVMLRETLSSELEASTHDIPIGVGGGD